MVKSVIYFKYGERRMERCRHCGEVIDRVDCLYCPTCGNRLSADEVSEPITESVKKKDKKKKKEVVVAASPVKGETTVAVREEKAVAVKEEKVSKYEYVSNGTRKSYIVFGIFALLIGALLIVTSGYWGASSNLFGEKFAEVMSKLSAKTVGKLFEQIGISELILRGVSFFSLSLTVLTFIYLITFFSLFNKKTTAGHVLIKISVLISSLIFIWYYNCMTSVEIMALAATEPNFVLPEQVLKMLTSIVESGEYLEKICYVSMIGGGITFVLGVILTCCKFSNPYNTTCYQFARSIYFLAISVFYFLVVVKGNTNQIIVKLASFLIYSLPYYLVLISIFMFASAKMKKTKVLKAE